MNLLRWRLIPLCLFALLVLFFWRGLSLEPQKLPSVQLGHKLPAFKLAVLGDEKKFMQPASMRGNIVLLNVWASWCPACVQEQVFLMKLAHEGMLIYGLNYKDNPASAKAWLKEWGNPYQLIAEDRKGKTAIDLGVYGAPETFLVDSQGVIQYRHVGILDEKSWQNDFLPRIKQLRKQS